MKKKILISILLISAFACTKKHEEEEEIRPVAVAAVAYEKSGPPHIFSGFSKSEKFVDVSFRVGGLIEKFPIKVGEKLEKGALIAQLDDQDLSLELQKTQSSLDEAQADSRKASAQYKRIKALYESESASRDELDTARAAHESAKAAVEKAGSAVNLAEKQLSYTIVRAESSKCEVSSKEAEIGENVKAKQTIATLSCGRILEVEIAIPESEISNITVNQTAEVYFNAFPGEAFSGTVTEVGVSSTGGATFPVTIALHEHHSMLRSGMAVKVIFPGEALEGKPTIIVPIVAVGEDSGGNFVYLFEPTSNGMGIARKQKVTVGELRPNGFTITSGLDPEDKIITAGLRYLQDGRKVKLLENEDIIKKKSD